MFGLEFCSSPVTSWDSPIASAAQQLSRVSSHLASRAISLWDSEYGCAPFINQSASVPVDKLMRLRSNLCCGAHRASMRVEADPKFTAINLNSMTPQPGVLQRNKLRLMTLIWVNCGCGFGTITIFVCPHLIRCLLCWSKD